MHKFYPLFATTIGAWLVHVALVNMYMKLFTDTHSVTFRLIYTLEITAIFCIAFAIYLAKVKYHVELSVALVTVVLFLAFVDGLLTIFMSSVRQAFDLLHFGVAYTVVALGISLVYKFLAR